MSATRSSSVSNNKPRAIEDLPPELLCHIFSFAARRYRAGKPCEKTENSGVPDQPDELRLSLVSRRWRSIALQVPELWTVIDFSHGLRLPQLYLSRARSHPLVIVMDVAKFVEDMPITTPGDLEFLLDYTARAMSMVLPSLERWRSFTLAVFDQRCMQSVMKSLDDCDKAPLLEELSLSVGEDADWEDPSPSWQYYVPFNGMLPKLTHLTLLGVNICWVSPFVAELQSLELAYHRFEVRPDFWEFAQMIGCSPYLHTLVLRDSGPADSLVEWRESMRDEDGTIHSMMIPCPSLKKLVLDVDNESFESDVAELTRFLAVSQLSDLEIKLPIHCLSTFQMEPCCTTFMSDLCGRDPSHLLRNVESCKLSYIRSDKWVWEFYVEMPKLKKLELDARSCHSNFYRYLRIPPFARDRALQGHGHCMFFSCLETLVVTGLSGRQLCALVKERRNTGYPLRRLYSNDHDPIRPDRIEWLKDNLDVFQQFHDHSMCIDSCDHDEKDSDAESDVDNFDWGWDEEDLPSSEESSEDS